MQFIIFSDSPSFFYLTKTHIDNAFLYFNKKYYLYVAQMNYHYAKKQLKDKFEIRIWKKGSIKRLIKNKDIGLEFEYIKASMLKTFESKTKVFDISEKFQLKRIKKSRSEALKIKKAAKATLDMIYAIDIKQGMKETEIKKMLLKEALDEGYEIAFPPIVASKENARFPHYIPSNKRVKDYVLIDAGFKYKGYCSDISEVIFFNNKYKKEYEKLKQSFFFILDNLNENMNGSDVEKIYEKAFNHYKLPLLPHAIGHGVGLEVHERPFIYKGSKDLIKDSVIAIEPAIYKNYGMRFEREIYVKKKAEVLI